MLALVESKLSRSNTASCNFGQGGSGARLVQKFSAGTTLAQRNISNFLPGTAKAYLTAAIFVGVAFLIRWGIGFVGKPLLPFTAFYPAVLFATYIGGWGVGMFAACLGGLVGWLAFMPSHVFAAGGTLELPFYAVACGLLIWGAESYRRLASSLQNEESFALTMALVIHELATNATKYGALSSAAGKLSIIWSVSDGKLSLEWRESGGPSVVTPTHRGFGLGLLHRALDQFNGSVDMTFEKPGLVCELKAAVPKNMASLLAQAETVEIEQSR